MESKGETLPMNEGKKICKNCAYAAARSKATRFSWCKYLCTLERSDNARWIPYKYPTDTCEYFKDTLRPMEGESNDQM